MRIFITGASSFIASNLLRKLLANGHTIYALVRKDSKNIYKLPVHDNLHIYFGDMNNIDSIELNDIAICLHFAWEGIGMLGRMNEDIQRKNVDNTLKLIKKCKHMGVKKFIFAGSQAEYGQSMDNHIDKKCDELVSEKAISFYGKAKLELAKRASCECEKLDISYIHLRIFSVYGYYDHETSLISTCIKHFRESDEILDLSFCNQKWNYIYIDECVDIINYIVEDEKIADKLKAYNQSCDLYKKNILNIAGNDTRILKEFVLELASIYKKSDRVRFIKDNKSIEGIPYLNPDISKLEWIYPKRKQYSFKKGVQLIEKMYNM